MAGISIDTSEVRTLAADMRRVDERMVRHVIPVVERGAVNVRNHLRDEAARSGHFRIGRHISYDMRFAGFGSDGAYEAEIGPEKAGAGRLANIAYFGGANGGGGTIPDPQGAGDAELPRFAQALADIAAELAL